MVGSKMQDFLAKNQRAKINFVEKNPTTNAGSSKIGHGFRK
jgi:hypothetical protein